MKQQSCLQQHRKMRNGATRATSACSEQRGNYLLNTRTHAHTNKADSFGCPLCFCLYLPCSSFMHAWSTRFFLIGRFAPKGALIFYKNVLFSCIFRKKAVSLQRLIRYLSRNKYDRYTIHIR